MPRVCGETGTLSESDKLLDAEQIKGLLIDVAAELPPKGPQHVIVVVGGALITWHGFRENTRDVDSVRRFDMELQVAAAAVASRHQLDSNWLNARAAAFRPQTLREEECEVLADAPRLRVLGAPLRVVFAMKLFASRGRDYPDLRAIWRQCGFSTAEEAVAFFYESYPFEEQDPYLEEHVRTMIANKS